MAFMKSAGNTLDTCYKKHFTWDQMMNFLFNTWGNTFLNIYICYTYLIFIFLKTIYIVTKLLLFSCFHFFCTLSMYQCYFIILYPRKLTIICQSSVLCIPTQEKQSIQSLFYFVLHYNKKWFIIMFKIKYNNIMFIYLRNWSKTYNSKTNKAF